MFSDCGVQFSPGGHKTDPFNCIVCSDHYSANFAKPCQVTKTSILFPNFVVSSR